MRRCSPSDFPAVEPLKRLGSSPSASVRRRPQKAASCPEWCGPWSVPVRQSRFSSPLTGPPAPSVVHPSLPPDRSPRPRHSFQRLLQAPATGYRHNTSGALAYVGAEGDVWSSSPTAADSPNATYLAFKGESWVNTFISYTFSRLGRAQASLPLHSAYRKRLDRTTAPSVSPCAASKHLQGKPLFFSGKSPIAAGGAPR